MNRSNPPDAEYAWQNLAAGRSGRTRAMHREIARELGLRMYDHGYRAGVVDTLKANEQDPLPMENIDFVMSSPVDDERCRVFPINA